MIKLPNWLLYGLMILVGLAWATAFIASLSNSEYKAPESLNALFSTMMGILFLQIGKQKNDKSDRDDDPDES